MPGTWPDTRCWWRRCVRCHRLFRSMYFTAAYCWDNCWEIFEKEEIAARAASDAASRLKLVDIGHFPGMTEADFEARAKVRYGCATVGFGVDIRESHLANAGVGLFATQRFLQGELITVYEGVITAHADVTETSHTLTLFSLRWHLVGNYTCPRLGTLFPIRDPARELWAKGGGAYANDNKGNPNSEFHRIDLAEHSDPFWAPAHPWTRMMTLRALRDIATGEEIFVSYGEDYWTRVENE